MADPLRRTLSKLRGKKSKRGKVTEAAPGDVKHPLANQNNNNYRDTLWDGKGMRELVDGIMTRADASKPPEDNCPCTACQGAEQKTQRHVWTQGTQHKSAPVSGGTGQGDGCSRFNGHGSLGHCEGSSARCAPQTHIPLGSNAFPLGQGHVECRGHRAAPDPHPLHGAATSRPGVQEGALLVSSQNGYTRAQHYPPPQWDQTRARVAQLATAHPGQARQLFASLQQAYRNSLQSQHSVDSDEDDYYDNDYLPFYEPELPVPQSAPPFVKVGPETQAGAAWGSLGCKDGGPLRKGSYQETDRLRSQLQEAYYLLIHAMHDMPLPAERCPSSAHSQDSIYSQPSPRAADSDLWSSGEASPQQGSDSESAGPALRLQCSKSLETLRRGAAQPPLHRSVSDGDIQYSLLSPGEPPLRQQGSPLSAWQECGGGPDSGGEGEEDSPGPAAEDQPVRRGRASSGAGHPSCADNEGRRDPVMCSRADGPGGPLRTSGVTVRKMQKWMYKGRLLSLEMKERIIGSSLRPGAPCGSGRTVKRDEVPSRIPAVPLRGRGGPAPRAELGDRPQLTELIENAYASPAFRDDMKVVEANEQKQQNNSITVSKKRNWLQQSSPKSPPNDGYDTLGNFPGPLTRTPTSLCSELHKLQAPGRSPPELHGPTRPHLQSASSVQGTPSSNLGNCAMDLSEDNDADDEGEIWYNPIPEDDEPDLLRGHCFSGINSAKADFQFINLQKRLPGSDLIKVAGHAAGSPRPSECVGEPQTAPANEINQADSLHSSQHCLQLHAQGAACRRPARVHAEGHPSSKPSEAGTGIKAHQPEFSTPSSPSPLKKVGPMNWSFPDRIKSPRTVRKLSMKMKKLPELSRKLSVKGTSTHSSSDNNSLSPKSNAPNSRDPSSMPSGNTAAANRNVISRYHLDSSVSSQHNYKMKNTGNSKSSSKGGYLSDGDSPELLTKSGKHGSESRAAKGKEVLPSNNNNNKTDIDIDAFRHYSFSEQPKCSHYISGLMSVHFYGAEDLKPARMDTKDVFCAIQVDSVNKARTALLTCRTTFLDMDHTFNIDLENAQHLKLVVFSWDPAPRKNRVCCHGTVVLPALFRVTKMHQLAVKLEPRGLIYVKVTLLDQWENAFNSPGMNREPVMFGVDARKVVEMENVGLMVPLLMEKCIVEIEKRGCQVVGLYRLCGSAAVKKELREAFERDSKNVVLCESQYPDINVITGVLKDYLRELPSPLITKQLYEAVLNAMVRKPLKIPATDNDADSNDLKSTVGLLDCLPDVEKATLKMLLDHLKRVASYHEVNKMTCQNLAVCFGPVLLSQRQETSNHNNRVFTDSEELASALDFKKHIEVLHYLLQMWPVQNSTVTEPTYICTSPEEQPYLRRKKRPQMLDLSNSEMAIRRPRPAKLDSPSSNRYAGDWSSCGDKYFLNTRENFTKSDYEDVPSEDVENGEEFMKVYAGENVIDHPQPVPKEHSFKSFMTIQEMDSTLDPRVDLQDLQESIDNLIGSLEQELNKNKLTVAY
ncbi:rho GTPase-activating protein SYDE2 [Ambystoma mexicanum]|uniref:rho GTPase-activating protein SYDE2 n=1 Tax=Ambystoma mexicanum TaxID=8296 RepID=UPI0037E6FCB8